MRRLEESSQQLVTLVVEQMQEMRGLRDEVKTGFRRPYAQVAHPVGRTTLVLDITVRDITLRKNDDGSSIELRLSSGATLEDIGELIDCELSDGELIDDVADKELREVVIVGGSRELMDKVPTAPLKDDLKTLIRKAKTVAPAVTVSSVLPIFKSHDSELMAEVNDAIRITCDEAGAKSVDNDVNLQKRRR